MKFTSVAIMILKAPWGRTWTPSPYCAKGALNKSLGMEKTTVRFMEMNSSTTSADTVALQLSMLPKMAKCSNVNHVSSTEAWNIKEIKFSPSAQADGIVAWNCRRIPQHLSHIPWAVPCAALRNFPSSNLISPMLQASMLKNAMTWLRNMAILTIKLNLVTMSLRCPSHSNHSNPSKRIKPRGRPAETALFFEPRLILN